MRKLSGKLFFPESATNQNFMDMKGTKKRRQYVYVAKFYDGANWSYMVTGSPICFGTKKKAREFIMGNIEAKSLRHLYLLDLKNA